MQKAIHTVFVNLRYYCFHYVLVCILVSIILYLIWCFIKKKKVEINKNNLLLILTNAYFILPIWSAVFSRFKQPHQDPFANIYGGWGIAEFQYTFDLALCWNIIMFAPMMIAFYWLLKQKKKPVKLYSLALISTFSSLIYSGVIEALQIVFKVGTFQISDLVYNTFGALIGSIITIIIIKRRCR